jgi:branched-chain amino acid transport system ATP-binding protein
MDSSNQKDHLEMLKVKNLRVQYGQTAALQNVSIKVNKGEVVCIVGSNGAGKSSLLLTIAGVLSATEGEVIFQNKSLTSVVPEEVVRLGISLVPEGRHIFSTLSVEENLRLAMMIRADKKAAEDDYHKVLDQFPFLRERLKSAGGMLSGGEQQQLAISRGLLTRPHLMMIDEPSLGLAPLTLDSVYDFLSQLREDGLTLLIVEQSKTRVLDFADRVYVVRSGQVVLSGTPSEIQEGSRFKEAYFGYAND